MLGLSQRRGSARQTVPMLLSLLAFATTVVAQLPEGEPNGNEPPAPDCSRCNDNIDLVCTADGRVYPNLCVAACTGRVSPMDIVNCAEDLIVEVDTAIEVQDAICANATCGATCGALDGCGWSTPEGRCIQNEVTTDDELTLGVCPIVDECLVHTCARDCNQTINCGWSTVQMQCISGAYTSAAELNMGDCMAGTAFNMCTSFQPCLNNGVCSTDGGYQFTCTCPTGFSGMVCEDSEADFANTAAPDDENAGSAGGVSGGKPKGSSPEPVNDDPFSGVFVGDELTAANAMVISIGVLIVSVIVSAFVLYYRRRKLRMEAHTFTGLVEGGVATRKRINMNDLDLGAGLEYDNEITMGIGTDGSEQGRQLQFVQGAAVEYKPPAQPYTISAIGGGAASDGPRPTDRRRGPPKDEYLQVDEIGSLSPRKIDLNVKARTNTVFKNVGGNLGGDSDDRVVKTLGGDLGGDSDDVSPVKIRPGGSAGLFMLSPESLPGFMKCAQCKEEAPSANGCIDEDDNKWYCNVCWRILDEAANSQFV